jgi:hypothetical protein
MFTHCGFAVVTIMGTLLFDRVDLQLNATYIMILGGALEVGTQAEPFMQTAVKPRPLEHFGGASETCGCSSLQCMVTLVHWSCQFMGQL